jgi:hypothetical protein
MADKTELEMGTRLIACDEQRRIKSAFPSFAEKLQLTASKIASQDQAKQKTFLQKPLIEVIVATIVAQLLTENRK